MADKNGGSFKEFYEVFIKSKKEKGPPSGP